MDPLDAPTHRLWALRIEYDGRPFIGWQRQSPRGERRDAAGGDGGKPSVQEVLEAAAACLDGGVPPASTVAGRTDSGVHATGQVAHLALPAQFSAHAVREALNFHLKPHPVVVLDAALAPDGFNARFSATGRRYRYTILNRRPRPALEEGRVWHVRHPLDADAMAQAASLLLGRHDFSTFRAASCQASSPVRTLDRLAVTRTGEHLTIEAAARSFLHHQVRNMVGSLSFVGLGRWSVAEFARAFAAADRRAGGPTAPPDGLVLTGVAYDPDPFAGR